MNQEHATGQKTTGTTDVIGAEYRKPPTIETGSFNMELDTIQQLLWWW